MKTCRFCLESIINENASTCSHCGHLQPTKEEINSAYRQVLSILVDEKLGYATRRGLIVLIGVGLLPILAIVIGTWRNFVFDGFTAGFLLFALIPIRLYYKVMQKYKTKIIFEDALLIEERLQNKLRELEVKKFRPDKPVLLYSLIILLFLAVSNPSTNEFKEFYKRAKNPNEEPSGFTKTNLIFCSRYQINGEKYWGVLGNFFNKRKSSMEEISMLSAELKRVANIWPMVSSILSVPRTEEEYERTVALLDELIDVVGENERHPPASLLDTLGTLIAACEDEHFPAPVSWEKRLQFDRVIFKLNQFRKSQTSFILNEVFAMTTVTIEIPDELLDQFDDLDDVRKTVY